MKKIALFCCAVAMLAGCSMLRHKADDTPACPMIGVLRGASFYPVIASDAPHLAEADLAASATMRGSVDGTCKYTKNNEVVVKVALGFAGRRGAKGARLDEHKFPYFVAILSPDDEILQRQEFSTTVDFDNTGAGASQEDHTIRIPLPDRMKGPAYKITAGFRLTPQQVTYNEENNAH
ncbi:MAG: hypothetical protein ACAH83_00065 [Alphaproteobacteria bacterium]